MCGFAGIINKNMISLDFDVLSKMNDEIFHRGPDDEGYALFNFSGEYNNLKGPNESVTSDLPCGVGFRRLSIQDLTYTGHQPMVSNDENVIIVFNGEIYNAPVLRKQLREKGIKFRGTSDTEVVLNYFVKYGLSKLLDDIIGMFSIFIVDFKQRKFFLIRDHFGIKPLYYVDLKGSFLFGSEVKSFLNHPDFKAKLDKENFAEYLMFRFCSQERTLLEGVKQVKPGHYLEISEDGILEQSYWDIKDALWNHSGQPSTKSIESLLKESVKSQLLSDVKVGCQLSGGIDSSLVTVYARKHFQSNMDSFSIVFKNKAFSEEKWIVTVCDKTDTHSHKFYLSKDYFLNNLKKASWHLDNPITIPNTIGIYLLAKGAKPYSTVLLSGEGADEVFCGYSRYFDVLNKEYLDSNRLYYRLPVIGNKLASKFKKNKSLADFFVESAAVTSTIALKKLLKNSSSLDEAIRRRKGLFPSKGTLLQKCSVYDIKTYLTDLLNRQDKMMMAHSVENRVPFLDRRLVTAALRLKDNEKVNFRFSFFNLSKPSNFTKHILKKLATRIFSKDFVYRKKSGFPLPMKDIMYQEEFVQFVDNEVLPSLAKREVLNMNEVNQLWSDSKRRKSERNIKLMWAIISFEIWAMQFLDG